LAGVPIVASDIEMNKEAVEHLKTGYLYKTQNVPSLVNALKFAVENYTTMTEMSVHAKITAQRLYDLDHIVRQHETIYNNCIQTEASIH
jgi:glycosyltransferase involved in cell wall biosynthesis